MDFAAISLGVGLSAFKRGAHSCASKPASMPSRQAGKFDISSINCPRCGAYRAAPDIDSV